MNTTAKTVMIALVIVSAAMMAGCLDGTETSQKNNINADMAQLEIVLTSDEYTDEEKYAAFVKVGEKYGAEFDATSAPTPEQTLTPETPKYRVGYTLMECGGSPLDGIGWFTVIFNGILEVDQTTVSGFRKLDDLNLLESTEIFVNNKSVAEFTPILDEKKKIETTEVGDWIVKIEVTFKDGSIRTIRDSKFNGMDDLSDHPDYKSNTITPTGSGPFDARYIETSDKQMSREEAKALCEELGIVWGDDRDI